MAFQFGGRGGAGPLQRPAQSYAPQRAAQRPAAGGPPASLAGYMGAQRPAPAQAQAWGRAPAAGSQAAQYMGARPAAGSQAADPNMMARMGGAMLSDEDEKEGIKRIGESESGPYDRPTKMDEGMLSGLMSDRHSKEQIQRLEGANQALASALRPAYPDTAAPSSGMQALGQQQPDNNATRVAKQNQVLSEGSPFAVGMQQPNLDELDEAYKRLGQGG